MPIDPSIYGYDPSEDTQQTEFYSPESYEEKDTQTSPEDNSPVQETDNQNAEKSWYEDIPESYRPPEKWDNDQAKEQWYQNTLKEATTFHQKPEFLDNVLKEYEKSFLEKEENIAKFNSFEQALKDGRPNAILKSYFGDKLESLGIKGTFSQEEMNDKVVQELSNRFGKDYARHYNEDEAGDSQSFSGQLISHQTKVLEQLQAHNQNIVSNFKMPDEREIQENINRQYESDFKSFMPTDKFNKFIESAEQAPPPTLKDIYNLMNHKEIVEKKYQEGFEAGRKKVFEEFNKAGGRKVTPDTKSSSRSEDNSFKGIDRYDPSIYMNDASNRGFLRKVR